MLTGQEYDIETDVAIIGGGTAGTNAAMAAAERGLDVLVVDKANINRSGAIAGGIDHFIAYLDLDCGLADGEIVIFTHGDVVGINRERQVFVSEDFLDQQCH